MTDRTREVVVRPETGEVVGTDFGMQAVVSVDQAIGRIKELQRFVHAVMVKGEDYGIIPGTQKPTLLKPGAEKLCEMYGLTPTFEIVESDRDWDAGMVYYEVKCALVSKRSGVIAAEGLGSCNSRESRYKNRDVYTLSNTILKMAKKRAHVDAALSATRSSGLFTQDLEDLVDAEQPAAAPTAGHQGASQARPTQTSAPVSNGATPAQIRAIYAIGSHEHNLSNTEVDERSHTLFGAAPAELSRKQASEFITSLKGSAIPTVPIREDDDHEPF